MNWIMLFASLAAVLALAGAAHALGLGGDTRIADRDHALRLAHDLGFDAIDARVEDGNTATAWDASGRSFVIRPHGVHFSGQASD